MHQNTIIMMRTCGERTSQLSKALILGQQAEYGVHIVNEVPFEKALKKCYMNGLDSGAKWMITLDSDVLLTQNSVEVLLQEADAMPEHFAQLEGRVFDKILGSYRPAGHRVYRTEMLALALKNLPQAGQEVRPEYYTLQQLNKLGHPSRFIEEVVGLHDFEQYYFDLYRKSVVHTKKHSYLVSNIIDRCTMHLHEDKDFLMILKGVWDGLTIFDKVSINKRSYIDSAKRALDELGLVEKDPIGDVQVFADNYPEYYASAISDYNIPEYITPDTTLTQPSVTEDWQSSIRYRIEMHGSVKGCVASFGSLLKKIGRYLDK